MPLPPPDERFTVETYNAAGWPIAVEKIELIDGAVVWSGNFTEEDADRARRTFPDRTIVLKWGCIWLHPAGYVEGPD